MPPLSANIYEDRCRELTEPEWRVYRREMANNDQDPELLPVRWRCPHCGAKVTSLIAERRHIKICKKARQLEQKGKSPASSKRAGIPSATTQRPRIERRVVGKQKMEVSERKPPPLPPPAEPPACRRRLVGKQKPESTELDKRIWKPPPLPPPAYPPAPMIHFEQQARGLGQCGLHALNNLIGEHLFTPMDMENAVEIFLAERPDLGDTRDDHISANGWYSSEVLATALRSK
eukprot:6488477-Amphidinium_carterae.1